MRRPPWDAARSSRGGARGRRWEKGVVVAERRARGDGAWRRVLQVVSVQDVPWGARRRVHDAGRVVRHVLLGALSAAALISENTLVAAGRAGRAGRPVPAGRASCMLEGLRDCLFGRSTWKLPMQIGRYENFYCKMAAWMDLLMQNGR